MTSIFRAPRAARPIATAAIAVSFAVCGMASATRADTLLPDRASAMRNAIVAMSLADAAMPFALAVSTTRDERPVLVPASSAAMKPETSSAMAAMKTASAPPPTVDTASYERRFRPYRDPFLLMLGIAY